MTARKSTRKPKKAAAAKNAEAAASSELKLDKELNIQGVADLKDKLSASLSSGEAVSIDAGSVESIDTAALQLLLAFTRHNAAQSGAVTWVETSDAFVESARMLDLDQHLGVGPSQA